MRRLSLVLIAGLVLVGCNSGGEDDEGPPRKSAAINVMMGEYTAPPEGLLTREQLEKYAAVTVAMERILAEQGSADVLQPLAKDAGPRDRKRYEKVRAAAWTKGLMELGLLKKEADWVRKTITQCRFQGEKAGPDSPMGKNLALLQEVETAMGRKL
jgi:hypothetical protein